MAEILKPPAYTEGGRWVGVRRIISNGGAGREGRGGYSGGWVPGVLPLHSVHFPSIQVLGGHWRIKDSR